MHQKPQSLIPSRGAADPPGDRATGDALVAQLGPSHRHLVAAHLTALPAADRYKRFGHAISDASIATYVQRLHFARDAMFGAVGVEGELFGFGHLAFDADNTEFAISVAPAARRQGLGLALLSRAAAHARNRGLRVLTMVYMPNNDALASLARRAGMQMVCDPAECRAYLGLEPATAGSVLQEAWREAVAALDLGFRLGGLGKPLTSA
jgi:ribosomal protein S18 acetylase RimI-like enzyme